MSFFTLFSVSLSGYSSWYGSVLTGKGRTRRAALLGVSLSLRAVSSRATRGVSPSSDYKISITSTAMMTKDGDIGVDDRGGGDGSESRSNNADQRYGQSAAVTSFAERTGPVYVHNPNHRESPTRAEAATSIQRLQRGKLARGASKVVANLRARDEAMMARPKEGLAGQWDTL